MAGALSRQRFFYFFDDTCWGYIHLNEELFGAETHRPINVLLLAEVRKHDDLHVFPAHVGFHLFKYLKAALTWQDDIEEHEVRRLLFQIFEHFYRIAGPGKAIRMKADTLADNVPQKGIVLNDEDLLTL